MIIDLILDLYDDIRDGYFWTYSPDEFAKNVKAHELTFEHNSITEALETRNNKLIQIALCAYIEGGEYNALICDFINGFDWTKEQNALTFAENKITENINTLIEWNFCNGNIDLSCKLAEILQEFKNLGASNV